MLLLYSVFGDGSVIKRRINIIIVIVLCSLIFQCCSWTSKPEDDLQKFITFWENQDYISMYGRLCSNSRQSIKIEDFEKCYSDIYRLIKTSRLSIRPMYWDRKGPDKEGYVHIPLSITMETMAGVVEFEYNIPLIKEKALNGNKEWFVVWDYGMIFPKLQKGDRVRVENIKAKRGEIKDRTGKGLAVNGILLSVGVVPGKMGNDIKIVKTKLTDILEIPESQIEKKLNDSWVKPHMFVPVANISIDEKQKIEMLNGIPGVIIREVGGRIYPYKEAAAHLIGYIGPIDKYEIETLEKEGYSKDDMIGKAGLELVYEKWMRGKDGNIIYTEDETGHLKDVIAREEPVNGRDIELTLDIEIQKDVYEELKGDSGGAAVVHPLTGEVLALVSSPSYDPNLFVLGLTEKQWSQLRDNKEKPMLDRFAQVYSPGSTFKPVTAAIALKVGAITIDKKRVISGYAWKPDDSWGDYYISRIKDTENPVNLRDALVYSDNIFFAQTALEIGEASFVREAGYFGFGEAVPCVYPVNMSQLANHGKFKSDIQLADSGYGQGEILVSPIHMAMIYTVFTNRGSMLPPVIEMKYGSESRKIWHEEVVSPQIAETLLKDLVQVVESPDGTGNSGSIQGVSIAGKTGTAEIKKSRSDENKVENGWFVAFNTDNPRILIAMIVENVKKKGGSSYVVKKVRKVMEEYFLRQPINP